MKTVLALSGISYGDPGERDWRRCIDNITDNVIKPMGIQDIYMSTYPSDTLQQLIETYQPKRYNVFNYPNSDGRETYRKTLELLLDQDFDIAITTRFDILFTSGPVSEYVWDPEKINLLFKEGGWWDIYRYTADPQTFCMFPKILLPMMIETVQAIIDKPFSGMNDMHSFYRHASAVYGEHDLNVIHDSRTLSHDNPYFIFDRWNPGFEQMGRRIRRSPYFENR